MRPDPNDPDRDEDDPDQDEGAGVSRVTRAPGVAGRLVLAATPIGDPGDAIVLRGPIVHEISQVNVSHLEMWDWDTIHDFVR